MFLTCPQCGQLAFDHLIYKTNPGQADAVCPVCAFIQPFRYRPLPVVTGASGSGKSTLALPVALGAEHLFCLESDILWGPPFDTPQDGYRAFRSTLLRVALNVNQSRVTTVLFSSIMPEDLAAHPLIHYFDGVFFLVLSCPDEVLTQRLRDRPAWRACDHDAFLRAMQNFNRHLQRMQGDHISRLDTSTMSIHEAETAMRQWVDSIVSIRS